VAVRGDPFRSTVAWQTPDSAVTTIEPAPSCLSSSAYAVYIGGEAGLRAWSDGRKVKPVLRDSPEDVLKETAIEYGSRYGGPAVTLGPTLESAIAQRRRSTSAVLSRDT